ncbi:Nitroreductase [Paenibacillus sophorae]|uniref:Nitroreductase n=1 Tax=Paenibacillus sophorae TaxID=1333845 RepID=A0A1H8SDD4_9BACL|nr:nitroreductase family protein [Paenibacillus sophorae]QWU16759.1 nitroreductase family protein [Paenibacillus sophorae]SEO76730.1 Nitroreductase [Paenibacillus sophorae]
MNKTLNSDFTEILTGRRSIRKYDPAVKISKEEMTQILTEATLAPSTVNMQPWRFLVIDSPEGKAALAPLARYNKQQVETSSAVIAVFGDMNSFDYAEEIYSTAVERGWMPAEVKEKQLAGINSHLAVLPPQVKREILLIDTGLVSMQLMLVARAHGYDTNPIGGYDKDKVAEAFGWDKERYVPVMLLSIGKAAEEGFSSVRLPIDKIAEWK